MNANKLNISENQEFIYFLKERILNYKEDQGGACASYIPELKKANPNHLAINLLLPNGESFSEGDFQQSFSIQSISKVISFIAACMARGVSYVLDWVGVEPTGNPFNSYLIEKRKPLNPMINAGALTTVSLLPGNNSVEKFHSVTDLLSILIGRKVMINSKIFNSELESAYRNRALANLLMENEFLASGVEETVLTYTKLCSINVTVNDLAKISLILAYDGFDPINEIQLIPTDIARLTKVLMYTCGMYNSSGEFAALVGIPAKSGVSGGILAIVPPSHRNSSLISNGCGIGIYGPAIDENGNSVKGIKLLKDLIRSYDVSIF
ncbi:glutaminase A [Bacillus tianshenii]|nr:glutaminase A [Bacillus tianshenii]